MPSGFKATSSTLRMVFPERARNVHSTGSVPVMRPEFSPVFIFLVMKKLKLRTELRSPWSSRNSRPRRIRRQAANLGDLADRLEAAQDIGRGLGEERVGVEDSPGPRTCRT